MKISAKRNYFNKASRNTRAEEYNNWDKNSIERINRRFKQTEENISKLINRTIEIIESEEKKEN